MSANTLSQEKSDTLAGLAQSYANGDAAAGARLIESVDEAMMPQLTHQIRAALLDAIMSGKKTALEERSSKLLRAALFATNDEDYLVKTGHAYLANGEQLAAETLLEWRVVLAARKQKGSPAHIDALMDLSDVYMAAGKTGEARDLREGAAMACEQRAAKDLDAARLLSTIAQTCYDASDFAQAESVLNRSLKLLDKPGQDYSKDSKYAGEILECLRLMHAFAKRNNNYDQAQTVAKRIQNVQGKKDGVDEIERALVTYTSLPDYFELQTRPDGIDLFTDNFPGIVKECSGLDLEQYFLDAFSQTEGLTPAQREDLAKGLFHVLRTVTEFVSGAPGATLTRSEETSLDLPAGLSQGFVQKVNFGTKVTFRLVPNPPDEATFAEVTGITFSVGGKLLAMTELSLKAVGDKCIVTPILAEAGQVKQSASSAIEALKNTGKDFLVGMFLKHKKFSFELPIVLEEYRGYLADAINLKRSLQYNQKDLLTFFERCSRIEVDDPLTRAILEKGHRICRKVEDIKIERTAASNCDMGGAVLKFAPTINLKMVKKTTEMIIRSVKGVEVKVEFDAPSELRVIGLDLRRALPTRIESLKLGEAKCKIRRMIVGTGAGKWIGFDVDQSMNPAFDPQGNWMVFGVTSNPISGTPQNFFLRLDKDNNLNMTPREIGALLNQTAMDGFDASDPSTWQWGAVAIGTQTLLTAGSVLRSTIGDESTDEIVDAAKKGLKKLKDFLF